MGMLEYIADVADAAVWLSQDGCFMTGQNLQVNGGLTLRGNPSRDEVNAAIGRATGGPMSKH